ncbi:hypothetical protein IV102_31035 [bacterium]|nr:hypothetical protein [bacterium]
MAKWLLWFCVMAMAWAQAYEAPQIWAVDGVSLAYNRLQIEQKVGPSRWDRPLKASWGGERWEYTYGSGLKAAFVDQDPGRHPRLLVGKHFTSRGRDMVTMHASKAQVAEIFGLPNFQTDEHYVYYDGDRLAYLTLHFGESGLDEVVLSRFRMDSAK